MRGNLNKCLMVGGVRPAQAVRGEAGNGDRGGGGALSEPCPTASEMTVIETPLAVGGGHGSENSGEWGCRSKLVMRKGQDWLISGVN